MQEDNKTLTETDIQSAVDVVPGKKTNIVMDSQILTSLMTCPRLTDFRFNMNLQSMKGKSNSLEVGSIVHTFLEVYYRSIIQGLDKQKAEGFAFAAAELYIRGCPMCSDFVPFQCPKCNGTKFALQGDLHLSCDECDGKGEITKPKCGHKINDYPGVHNTPVESEGYKTGWKWALDTCEQYLAFYKNDHWVPLEVEVVKSKVLYEDDNIRVLWKAKLDLVCDTNQGIFPTDHKTMKQRRATSKLNNQFKGQCLVQDSRSVIINKIGFQTTLKPQEKFERVPVSYSAPQLAEWCGETLPFYANLLLMYAEGGYFPPNYSNCEGKYGPCAFIKVCEANPDMREHELKEEFVVGPEWNPTNEGDD